MIRLAPTPTYFYQGDSQIPGQAWRSCFSSADAMLVEQIKPGTLLGHKNEHGETMQGDDYYLSVLRGLRVGDTTEYTAQLATLAKFGVKAHFTTVADWSTIETQLARGKGVPIGILHHGPVSMPAGGGHWIFVIGIDNENVYVHDPAGELDVVNGGYLDSSPIAGKSQKYSKANLGPRWMVAGTLGWAIIAE